MFKIEIQPYNLNSLKIIFSIFTVYSISYFININTNPLLEIMVRSVGIIITYLIMIYFLGISPNNLISEKKSRLKKYLELKF